MRSKLGEPLGFHGVVLPSDDPARDARRCAAALGLEVLRRSAREVVLGRGPELFVSFVRAPADTPVELHLAVKGLRAPSARADDLGGDGVTYDLGFARVTVREFRRPPSSRWKARARGRKTPRRSRSR